MLNKYSFVFVYIVITWPRTAFSFFRALNSPTSASTSAAHATSSEVPTLPLNSFKEVSALSVSLSRLDVSVEDYFFIFFMDYC